MDPTSVLDEFFLPDNITTVTDMFKETGANVQTGLKAITPAAFALFVTKYVWRVGKSFFTSLAR